MAAQAATGRLRVGVLLDGRRQERWVDEALRLALAVPGAQLGAVALLDLGRPRRPPLLRSLLDRLDRAIHCRGETLFERIDVSSRLNAPALELAALRRAGGWTLDREGAARLCACDLDLWLCFTRLPPARPLPPIARRGVWSLEIGGRPAAQARAGAAEIAAASTVTTTTLTDCMQPPGADLYRSHGTTIRASVRRNRLLALRKGLPQFARLMAALGRVPGGMPLPPLEPAQACGPPAAPRAVAIPRLCGRVAAHLAANRWKRLRFREQWRIAYCFLDGAGGGAPSRWRTLIPPAGRLWADPFVAEQDGRHVVFFEEFGAGCPRGRIMAAEVFARGEPGPVRAVLERPYHLSYPFMFRWNGALWMLPETGENRTVELYRCQEFPWRWRLERVLLEGVAAYDATLCEAAGGWWMFANVAAPGADCNDELHLYHADSPLGPWTPHRANPVVSDVRCARPAGPLFAGDGVLYRPSQDSSRHYGEAIVVNRVLALDRDRYRETPALRIQPVARHGVRGVHTMGAAGQVAVVDFLVRRRRW